MSQINVDTIKKADGTGSLTVPAESGTVVTTASPSLGRRNLIINGAMQVAQRGTTGTSTGYDSVDRFEWGASGMDQLGGQSDQSTDAPTGFSNSYKITVTTAETTLDADERLYIQQKIEAHNLQQLCYGTSDAKTTVLSFWVKSSQTGIGSIWFYQGDATRAYTGNYTINSADTWEYKTVTISGDTSGTINNDNGPGLTIRFHLAAGSDLTGGTADEWAAFSSTNQAAGQTLNLAETLNATWQITGVQLEVGSVATPFEHRSFGEEMELCKRYYQKSFDYGTVPAFDTSENQIGISMAYNASTATGGAIELGVEMRTTPTVTYYSRNVTTGNYWGMYKNTTWIVATTGNNGSRSKRIQFYVQPSGGGMTAQNVYELSGNWTAEAEL